MGGSQKHMMHPYDNLDLTFSDLAKIAFEIGTESEREEKIDGINITWKVIEGEIRIAFNISDIKSCGMTLEEARIKFDNHPAKEQFYNAFDWLENIKFPQNNTDHWFNCDWVDKSNPQLLRYTHSTMVIHHTCVLENNQMIEIAPSIYENKLLIMLQEFYGAKHKITVKIPEIEAKYYEIFLKTLKDEMHTYNLSENDTLSFLVGKYIIKSASILLPINVAEQLAEKLVNSDSKINLNDLKKMVRKDLIEEIQYWGLAKNKMSIIAQALTNIKEAWVKYTAKVLENTQSSFIDNIQKEKLYVNNLLSFNRTTCIQYEKDYPELLKEFQYQYSKFNRLNVSPQILEGFIFHYNGLIYKVTGGFASLNRACGVVRYNLGIQYTE